MNEMLFENILKVERAQGLTDLGIEKLNAGDFNMALSMFDNSQYPQI